MHPQHKDLKCYFLNISIADQIKKLFSRPGFFTSLQHRFTRTISPGYIGDMYDGALYRHLSRPGAFLSYQSNISFQWNTDGVPLFSSSSYSMWPLYLKIKSLAGVWFGDKKPSINTFLKPLCTTMNSLFYNGLTVQPSRAVRSYCV